MITPFASFYIIIINFILIFSFLKNENDVLMNIIYKFSKKIINVIKKIIWNAIKWAITLLKVFTN